eukprot:3554483-Lingulodinium_polyedra.AAC.1
MGAAVHPCRRSGARAAAGPARAPGPCAARAGRRKSACFRTRVVGVLGLAAVHSRTALGKGKQGTVQAGGCVEGRLTLQGREPVLSNDRQHVPHSIAQ